MDCVRYAIKEKVAYLAIDRPSANNMLDEMASRVLLQCLADADEDDDVGLIVLGGHGAFCGGVDPAVLEGVGVGLRWSSVGDMLDIVFYPIVRRMRALSKPTIAAIDGVAAGFGMSLALSCDFRICTENMVLIPISIALGLVPDGGALWHLARLVGCGRAMEIGVFSESMCVEKAFECGLVTWRADPGSLDADVAEAANRVADVSRIAVLEIRELLAEACSLTLNQALESEKATMSILGETPEHARMLSEVIASIGDNVPRSFRCVTSR